MRATLVRIIVEKGHCIIYFVVEIMTIKQSLITDINFASLSSDIASACVVNKESHFKVLILLVKIMTTY